MDTDNHHNYVHIACFIWILGLYPKRGNASNAEKRLLIGLAHDRIIWLGMQYIERGWISQDEYENLHDYLFIPYSEAGGNGSAAKVMKDVDNLPVHKTGYKSKER